MEGRSGERKVSAILREGTVRLGCFRKKGGKGVVSCDSDTEPDFQHRTSHCHRYDASIIYSLLKQLGPVSLLSKVIANLSV
jgi:hypothetical protein